MKLKYPATLSHLTLDQLECLKIKSLIFKDGILSCTVYDNISDFLDNNVIEDFIGPFKDKINNETCLRFESKAAAAYISQ